MIFIEKIKNLCFIIVWKSFHKYTCGSLDNYKHFKCEGCQKLFIVGLPESTEIVVIFYLR